MSVQKLPLAFGRDSIWVCSPLSVPQQRAVRVQVQLSQGAMRDQISATAGGPWGLQCPGSSWGGRQGACGVGATWPQHS